LKEDIMTTPETGPPPTARIQQAIRERPSTDYVFRFWSALGWTLLTFGLYFFYVFFQLIRRCRDHNRRRAELLLAAQDLAWQRATEQGKADVLRPAFAQVRNDVESLRAMDTAFREPTLWLLASVVGSGLVWLAGAILLDQDLVRHERAERAAESGLTSLFAQLGATLPSPTPVTKQQHNYVRRLLAVVLTLGLYTLWWLADLMREGNDNFQQGYAWEDALARLLGSTGSIAA
jgi:hypothetical protein